jgi:hypothetical protein
MKGVENILFSESMKGNTLDYLSKEEKNDFSRKLICKLSRQSVERIDRVRDVAGRLLHRILWSHESFPVNRKAELQGILPEYFFLVALFLGIWKYHGLILLKFFL